MGASPLMSIGLRAMNASYAALQTAGHNIANANTAGYSRQQVELATAKGQFTGAGFFGKGVDVQTVTRSHNEFLTRQAAVAASFSSFDSARLARLQQLEPVFATGEQGLGYATGQFMSALADLANQPADSSTRQVVLARASDLAGRFASADAQFDTIQRGVTEDLKTAVESVNGIAKSLAEVNDQIAAARGLGQPPNDLLDQRDRLVAKLSEQVQVSTLVAEDGTMAVFVGGGQRLVLGTEASQLRVVHDPDDPSRSAVALADGSAERALGETTIGGGAIAGLLHFQNVDLVDARNLVGQLASAVAGAVNRQQTLGANLLPPAGSVPSQPLFAVGAPQALPAAGNARDAGGSYLASVSLAVVDASQLAAANYELRADPAGTPGSYQLTRLSDPPLVRLVASGDVVDGMRIEIGTPPPAPTDRFLLKPVGAAAGGMQCLLDDPRALAAASPLVATAADGNSGSMTVESFTMTGPPADASATATIDFTSDAGDYAWELRRPDGTLLASGSGVWQPDRPIPAAGAADIDGFALRLAGVPKAGDRIAVAPTPAAALAANNGNAIALAALAEAPIVGGVLQGDGSVAGGVGATDAYASAMAAIGVRVQSAESAAQISTALSTQAEAERSSEAGVNLDEEAARLMQFQQSYQAAAKVLQIAQSLFAELLQTAQG
jgi:flagellar hook-associated protein 1 FlgK